MPLRHRIAVALALLALAAPASASASAQDSVLVPADTAIAGKSQAEWSRAWWEWAGSFDDDESPVADETGETWALWRGQGRTCIRRQPTGIT